MTRRTARTLLCALVVAAPLAAQQPIAAGSRVRGALAAGDAQLNSGEFMDAYIFQGRAGQRLVIRMTSAAFDSYLMMRGPGEFSQDNDDEVSGNPSARLDVRLPADGPYRIIVTSFRPGETGDYQVEVAETGGAVAANAPLAAPGGGSIAVGQSARGSLARGDDTLRSGEFMDVWRLAGRRGQQIVVRLVATDFDPYLMVRGPGDFSQDNDDDDTERGSRHSRLALTLPADGEYRVIATSYRPGEAGGYALSVAGGGGAAPATTAAAAPATGGTLTIGQPASGRLESGDAQLRGGEFADTWNFAGRSGQRLEIRLNSNDFDPYVAIAGPGGFSAYNDDDVDGGSNNSHLVITLPADGAYQVMATSYRAGEAGSYQLRVSATDAVTAGAGASVAAQSLATGRPVPGTLGAGDDTLQAGEFVDRYSFSGAPGQRVAIDMSSAAFDTYLQLVSPSGRQEENDDAASGSTNSRIETVLTEAGAYTVLATAFERGLTGAYQLTLGGVGQGVRVTAAAPGAPATPGGAALTAGTPQTGRLQAGDATLPSGEFVDRFAFAGRRGQVATVDMQSTELDAYLIVAAPSGAQQENDDASTSDRNARVTWVLPEDGTYTVVATSYRPGEAGAYSVRYAPGAGAVAANRPAPGRPATPADPGRGTRAGQRVWALSVGISAYGGTANDLPYTAEDAIKINEALQRAGVLGAGSIVLTDAEATYDRVRAAFQQVASQAGPDDVFLFFYSGHGTQLRQDPTSREPDLRDEGIVLRDRVVSDDEMAQWFGQVRSRMAIIALDACFSGGFARDVVTRPGIMGLFSSEEDLTSAVAGKFQAGGYLAHFLRTGLGVAGDGDHNGAVTAGELSTYLRRQFAEQAADVEAVTSERQRNYQFLVIERGGVKIDDVVLALR